MISVTRTCTTHAIVHGAEEFPTSFKAETDYLDPHVKIVGDKAVVGYLVRDEDVEDPLNNDDYAGSIFTAHRHAGKASHEGMQDALALNSDWQPDLELDEVVDRAQSMLARAVLARLTPEILARINSIQSEYFGTEVNESVGEVAIQIAAGFEDGDSEPWMFAATILETRSHRDVPSELDDLMFDLDLDQTQGMHQKAWEALRTEGKIGNPHAVVLDIYEHSGTHYSISGGGMQCQWDTASGGAVWVPSKDAAAEIERRALVYMKGSIVELQDKYHIAKRPPAETFEPFPNWHTAFNHLATLDDIDTLEVGLQRARNEFAGYALDEYNAWLAGDCWGTVLQHYERNDSGEWEPIDEDACWGYIGSKNANESLESEMFRSAADKLEMAQ